MCAAQAVAVGIAPDWAGVIGVWFLKSAALRPCKRRVRSGRMALRAIDCWKACCVDVIAQGVHECWTPHPTTMRRPLRPPRHAAADAELRAIGQCERAVVRARSGLIVCSTHTKPEHPYSPCTSALRNHIASAHACSVE